MSLNWSAWRLDWSSAFGTAVVCYRAPVEELGCNSRIVAADDDDDEDADESEERESDEDAPLGDEPFTIEEDDFFDENDFDDDFDDDFQEEYEELEADFGDDDEEVPENGKDEPIEPDEDF